MSRVQVDIEADDAAASSADAAPVVETEAEKAAKKEEMEKALKELQDKHNAVRLEDGDYQVQVHVIEVRDLKGENKDGTSDPVVFVEVSAGTDVVWCSVVCHPVYTTL